MSRTLSHSPQFSLDDMQHFVMEDASWELYEKLLHDIGNRPIRVTYDDGRMEVISPLPEHETEKKLIAGMIEMLAFQLNIPMACFGSTTFRRKSKAKGLEPDECYYFRHEEQMRGKTRLDLRKDPPPDLAVEIDVTSRSVPRQPVYAALGVPEIWRYDGRQLQCLHLVGKEYRTRKMSLAFPFLEPARLKQFIDKAPKKGNTAILKEFVAWVGENGWTG